MEKLLVISEDKKSSGHIVKFLESKSPLGEILLFGDGWDALSYVINRKDVYGVLIDLDSSSCDNLRFVKILNALNNDIEMTFMSKNGRYAIEAFSYNVSGYLMKPIDKYKLFEAIEKMQEKWIHTKKGDIYIKTFGAFEIMVKGRPLHWRNSKTKELLAFLVDARGDNVSSKKIQKTLWPDVDLKKSSAIFHTTLHHLRKTLGNNKIELLLECSRGSQKVNPDQFKCDFYEFEKEIDKGDHQSCNNAFDLYKGHYLENNTYAWSQFNKVRLQMLFDKVCQSNEYLNI